MKKIIIAVLALAAAFALPAFADETGERMAKTCAGCHGTNGASPGDYIPTIGGQNEVYLEETMAGYKQGARPESVEMNLMASGYTDEQLDSISAWYAGKEWVSSDSKLEEFNVDASVELIEDTGCADCHMSDGTGVDEIPRIAGQNPGYLREVLKRYKNGEIKSEEMSVMQEVSEIEIRALAAYYSALGRNK
ncbi:c-type cytochrome [Limisalsivibrio acetivorans]|uniref:c-type cytochrome n=1 Tax=Limisalsivibrio acetivorans TaxID=1304888 RepID=UPI0003B5ED00|nr:c-type cytochrome [Limisalsivibrio acetivorans]